MDRKRINRSLSEFNGIVKESDEIYRCAAKACGLSDSAFWILYTLRTEEETYTQSEICNILYQPKQTVNSALKKLEQDGYIRLTEMKDRRSRRVNLTEKGRKLAEKTVDRIVDAEMEALSGLTEEERRVFIGLSQKYIDLLKENMQKLT